MLPVEGAKSFEDMPDGIVTKILSLAGKESIANVRLVCTTWSRKSGLVVTSLSPKVFHKNLFRGKNTSFAALKTLDLSRSSGVTDSKLGLLVELQQLTGLKLKRCRDVSDAGLVKLGELRNLIDLNLARCLNISDEGIVQLAAVATGLRSLNIKYCYKITDKGLKALSNLPNLAVLNCSHCRHVSDQGMIGLMGLSNLHTLKISDCDQITDRGVEAIGSLSSLTALHAVMERTLEQQKTNESLRIIGSKLLKLATLKISFSEHMTISGVRGFLNLHHLQELILGRVCLSTDELFPLLGNIQSLEVLKIVSWGGISAEGLMHLTNLSNLRVLGLKATTTEAQIPDSAVEALANLANLKELSIWGFREITGDTLQCLINLEKLRLIHCPSLDSTAMASLVHMPKLRCLSLSANPGIKDEGVALMAEATSLETIMLCDCMNITGRTLGSLSQVTNLKTLTVSFCQKLCDEGMEAIANISTLTDLNVTMCQHLTDRGILALANGNIRNLKVLSAAGCDLVTWPAFQSLQSHFPQLTIERKSLHPSLINVLGNSVM